MTVKSLIEKGDNNRVENKVKREIKWAQLFFCSLWFIGAVLIFVLYQTDSLSSSFPVPRIIGWIYDLFGIVIGSVIQILVTGLGIFTSFSKKPVG